MAAKKKATKTKAKKTTEKLSERKCVPCDGNVPPLEPDEIKDFLQEISKGWKAVKNHHIVKRYEFSDFAESWEFVNFIGEIAEEEGHHPDINFGWGYAEIKLFTHAIDGLSESDFILAAKIDEVS
jgi:4a-hydroxytetrahydrobiopterin dehydratase